MPANQKLKRASEDARKQVGKPDYIDEGGQVFCTLCGSPLISWAEVGETPEGKVMVSLFQTPSYTDWEVSFKDDGAKHIMSLCPTCPKKASPETMKAVYLVHMERLAETDKHNGSILDWSESVDREVTDWKRLG